MTDPDGFGDRVNRLPKYVASRTLRDPTWNATVIQGEVRDAVYRLKRENRGDILMYGSAMLGQTLVEHDLIDEIRLMVHRHRRARSASAGGRGHDKDVAVGRYHTDWFWDRDDAVRTGTLTHSEHTRW